MTVLMMITCMSAQQHTHCLVSCTVMATTAMTTMMMMGMMMLSGDN